MEENNVAVEKQNIFNDCWYSITKTSEYQNLANKGIKKALTYLLLLTLSFVLIFTILSVVQYTKIINLGITYIEKNMPDFTYLNGTLDTNSEGKVELENEYISTLAGGETIIDTYTTDNAVVQQYIDSFNEERGIILLKDKLITVNWSEVNYDEYTYSELLDTYLEETDKEFNKSDLITYIKNQSSFSFFLQYFYFYFIEYLFIFIIFVAITTIIGIIVNLILKTKIKFTNILSMSIYSITVPNIIYMILSIINFFTNFQFPYFGILYLLISSLYIIMAIVGIKKDCINKSC